MDGLMGLLTHGTHYNAAFRLALLVCLWATAVTAGSWAVFSLAALSHHLFGWPGIH